MTSGSDASVRMPNMWEQVEPVIREKAYRTIESDPRVLLEGDGGPVGVQAEVYLARLYGLDGEVVEDGMRLAEPLPLVRVPLPPRFGLVEDEYLTATMRTANYVMQGGYALVPVAAEYAPPWVRLRDDFTFRVLYLRYQRRLSPTTQSAPESS